MPVAVEQAVARVATQEDAGSYLDAGIHLIRTDPDILNPWYLAGYLSSRDRSRQAMSTPSSLGANVRIDPHRVRILLLPIEQQNAYGEAFRCLAGFTRTLYVAQDLGYKLTRNWVDAITANLSVINDDTNEHVPTSVSP